MRKYRKDEVFLHLNNGAEPLNQSDVNKIKCIVKNRIKRRRETK